MLPENSDNSRDAKTRHPGLSRCDWKVLEMLGPWPMMPRFIIIHYHSQNPHAPAISAQV